MADCQMCRLALGDYRGNNYQHVLQMWSHQIDADVYSKPQRYQVDGFHEESLFLFEVVCQAGLIPRGSSLIPVGNPFPVGWLILFPKMWTAVIQSKCHQSTES